MVKCLNIGKNIGKPIYRSISTANSAGRERLRQEGETSRSRGETGDGIPLNES